MKKLPLVVFIILIFTTTYSFLYSYYNTKSQIEYDVNKALELTLIDMPDNIITTDTIKCYRGHITIAELKDTAYIAMQTVRKENKIETKLIAEANCSPLTIINISNQKYSSILFCISIIWLLTSFYYSKKYNTHVPSTKLTFGGIIYSNEEFMTEKGNPIHLTPMQYSLMKMFMDSNSHTLSKQEICDKLWPKKNDASDTLYTLIKRIKPIIEKNSNLKIESDRGKSYSLKLK
jgi:hypothetical protein